MLFESIRFGDSNTQLQTIEWRNMHRPEVLSAVSDSQSSPSFEGSNEPAFRWRIFAGVMETVTVPGCKSVAAGGAEEVDGRSLAFRRELDPSDSRLSFGRPFKPFRSKKQIMCVLASICRNFMFKLVQIIIYFLFFPSIHYFCIRVTRFIPHRPRLLGTIRLLRH